MFFIHRDTSLQCSSLNVASEWIASRELPLLVRVTMNKRKGEGRTWISCVFTYDFVTLHSSFRQSHHFTILLYFFLFFLVHRFLKIFPHFFPHLILTFAVQCVDTVSFWWFIMITYSYVHPFAISIFQNHSTINLNFKKCYNIERVRNQDWPDHTAPRQAAKHQVCERDTVWVRSPWQHPVVCLITSSP